MRYIVYAAIILVPWEIALIILIILNTISILINLI